MIRGCFLLLLLPLLLLSCPLRQVGSNRVKTFTGRPSPVLLSCSRARNFNFVWYCSPAIRIKIPFKGGGPQLKFFSNAHTQTRVSNAWKRHFYPRNGNEFVTNLIRNGKVSTNERIQMFRNNIFIFFFTLETNFNKFFYIREYLFTSKRKAFRIDQDEFRSSSRTG